MPRHVNIGDSFCSAHVINEESSRQSSRSKIVGELYSKFNGMFRPRMRPASQRSCSNSSAKVTYRVSSVPGIISSKPLNLIIQKNVIECNVTVESVQEKTVHCKHIESSLTRGTIGPKRANLNRTAG